RPIPLRLLDVARPSLVRLHRVDAEADDLRVSLVELGLEAGHLAQLRRAHRSEILRVGEQHAPGPAERLVKADRTLGRLNVEIGSYVANLQCHEMPPPGKRKLSFRCANRGRYSARGASVAMDAP